MMRSIGNTPKMPGKRDITHTEWLIHFDFERPNQALDYLTPFEFHQKYHKMLPMYPSSARV